jgi:hypothetical protein
LHYAKEDVMKPIVIHIPVLLAMAGCLATGFILGNPAMRIPAAPVVERAYVAPDFEYLNHMPRGEEPALTPAEVDEVVDLAFRAKGL